jgi:hypothetical protein
MRKILPAIALIFAVALYAADFWKAKDPSQWTDEEVAKMLTKSPWARVVSLQVIGMPGGVGGEAGGGGGGGGRSGRSGGGGGMGDAMPSGMSTPPITVRWESSAPVRAAQERRKYAHSAEITEWSKENFVVSLTGFRPRPARPGGPPEGSRSGGGVGEPQGDPRGGMRRAGGAPDSDTPDFRGAMIRHDNKQSFPVDRTMIIRTARGPELYLLFSRKNEIASATKEIIIDFSIGTTKVQAKFKIKDMEYRGKLEF